MSLQRGRSRLSVIIPSNRKYVDFEPSPDLNVGNLSPDLQPATPPTYPTTNSGDVNVHPLRLPTVSKIGDYVLHQQMDYVEDIQIFKAFHCDSQEEFICKVIPIEKYRDTLAAYWRVGSHNNINEVEEVLLGTSQAYVFFAKHYGDLHSYVRQKRRLREVEAGHLFHQIASAVAHCHENGVVLRDLKLRKFVFKNPEKTELKLESLEDAYVLEDDCNDCLADKHGCPAYVSPEILNTTQGYSGRAADLWSIGVMLYTIMVGRYPFHDVEPSALFTKIRRGDYRIPDTVSSRAKCLIRSLLRKDPSERLGAEQVLQHPWFSYGSRVFAQSPSNMSKSEREHDRAVPELEAELLQESIFV